MYIYGYIYIYIYRERERSVRACGEGALTISNLNNSMVLSVISDNITSIAIIIRSSSSSSNINIIVVFRAGPRAGSFTTGSVLIIQIHKLQFEGLKSYIQIHRLIVSTIANPS